MNQSNIPPGITENDIDAQFGDEPVKVEEKNETELLTLKQIKKWANSIAGNWDGDMPGSEEEKAGQANDILESVRNLEELINGMEEL